MNIMKIVKIRGLLVKWNATWIWLLYTFAALLFTFIVLLAMYYDEIPTKKVHMNRNKHNVLPSKHLKLVKEDIYIDEDRKTWMKRPFYLSLLHNPLKNYVFETISSKKVSSSEAIIKKSNFDKGVMKFENGSFNFFSSYNHPVDHFFADVLPDVLYGVSK